MMNSAINVDLFSGVLTGAPDSLFNTDDNSTSPFTQQGKKKNQDVSWPLIAFVPLVIKHQE